MISLPGIKKTYIVFTDQDKFFLPDIPIYIYNISHQPWPYSTMYRSIHYYKFCTSYKGFTNFSHAFAIDADTYFSSEINPSDVLYDLVGVQHCRYINHPGEYETNQDSACYVDPKEAKIYYGGGFYGGSWNEFIKINNWMTCHMELNIKTFKHDIIPRWHDESALNRYFFEYPPTKVLSPAFHWPEFGPDRELNPFIAQLWENQAEYIHKKWGIKPPFEPKIVLIDKYQGKSNGADEWRK